MIKREWAGRYGWSSKKVNSVLNIIDDTILNRDKRSLNEPTTIRKNGIRIGKNNTTSQALARVS